MPITPLSASVGPTSVNTSGAGKGRTTLGKEEFLTLLVAQLRNQDPLSPTNPEQMAAQLAQFSSLEQLINVNDRLLEQSRGSMAMATSMNNGVALGLLGQRVLAAGNSVDVTGSGDEVVTVGVGGVGGAGTLKVYDLNGNQVAAGSLGWVGAGRQDISVGSIVSSLAPGRYRYELAIQDAEGGEVQVQSFQKVSVDGVRYSPDGPILLSGGTEIPLSDVAEVISKNSSQLVP